MLPVLLRARPVLLMAALMLALAAAAQEPPRPTPAVPDAHAKHHAEPADDAPAAKDDPTPVPVPDAEAKAVMTLYDGAEIPKVWPLGKPLVLSAKKSTCGARPKSVEWHITPAWLEAQSLQQDNRRTLTAATGTDPKTMTVKLTVYKNDTGDTQVVPVKLVPNPGETDNPTPTPTPPPDPDNPTPPPNPDPTPTPGPGSVAANGLMWSKELVRTWCDSFDKAREDVLAGAPVAKIQADHAERWKATRNAAFDARFVPIFDAIIPAGTEPNTENRRKFADAMAQIIAGARKGVQ